MYFVITLLPARNVFPAGRNNKPKTREQLEGGE
jgi:hypothetical protein